MSIVVPLLGCMGACAFFALLFHAPVRRIPPASAVGALSYGVYLAVLRVCASTAAASFAAALSVAFLSELLARRLRAPATIFISVGIIPLVPGVGLYETMLHLIRQEYPEAWRSGAETLLVAGSIAMAVAIVGSFARAFTANKR